MLNNNYHIIYVYMNNVVIPSKNENTGTRASPEEQLSITLAWDRADIAKDHILVYGQQWQVQ